MKTSAMSTREMRRFQAKQERRKPRETGRKSVNFNSLEMARLGALIMPEVVVNSYIDPLRELILRIKLGQEELWEWKRVRDAAVVTQALMEVDSFKVNFIEEMSTGWFEAIQTATDRRRTKPRDGLTGKEREELDLMLNWYQAMMSSVTQKQLLEAQTKAIHRIRDHLGKINKEARAKGMPECSLGPDLAKVAEIMGLR